MDMSHSELLLSELAMEDMDYDLMSELFDTIDQPCETKKPEISYQQKSISVCVSQDPIIDSSLPPSNTTTFTISFGDINPNDEMIQFHESLGYEDAPSTTKVTVPRKRIQEKDHILAERKRRQKLHRHFMSLSSLLPKLKKMDRASLLEEASRYIKELEGRVRELEGLVGCTRKDVCVIAIKRSRPAGATSTDDEYSMISGETTTDTSSPDIQVRMSGTSVLVRIQCQQNFSYFVNALTQMQNLGLSIVSSSAMPFANTTLLITIVAQIEDEFSMTATELVNNLQLAIG